MLQGTANLEPRLPELGFAYTGMRTRLHFKSFGKELEKLWMSLSRNDFRP